MIKIQHACIDDIEVIRQIGMISYQHHFAHLYQDQHALKQYLEQEYGQDHLKASLNHIDQIWYLIQNKSDFNIGIIKLSNQVSSDANDEAALFIEKIYLLSGYTGLGYGAEILKMIEIIAKQQHISILYLEVLALNTQGIAFYERNAFQTVEKYSTQIFGQDFDLLIMAKNIASE